MTLIFNQVTGLRGHGKRAICWLASFAAEPCETIRPPEKRMQSLDGLAFRCRSYFQGKWGAFPAPKAKAWVKSLGCRMGRTRFQASEKTAIQEYETPRGESGSSHGNAQGRFDAIREPESTSRTICSPESDGS